MGYFHPSSETTTCRHRNYTRYTKQKPIFLLLYLATSSVIRHLSLSTNNELNHAYFGFQRITKHTCQVLFKTYFVPSSTAIDSSKLPLHTHNIINNFQHTRLKLVLKLQAFIAFGKVLIKELTFTN